MSGEDIVEQKALELEAALRRQLAEVRIDRKTLRGLLKEMPAPTMPAAGGIGAATLFKNLASIEAGENQGQILTILVRELSAFARGTAVILLGDPESNALPGPGLGLHPGQPLGMKKVAIRLSKESAVYRAAKNIEVIAEPFSGSEADTALYRAIGVAAPAYLFAAPVVVRGKVQAVVILDSDSPAGLRMEVETAAVMIRYAGMCLELLPLRNKVGHVPMPKITSKAAEPSRPSAPVAAPPKSKPSFADDFEIAEPPAVPTPGRYPGAGEIPGMKYDTPPAKQEAVGEARFEVEEEAVPKAGAVDLGQFGDEEREKHERALRFARLLVSEIKLYNEGAVRLGRENADIMSRLRDDIERSRALYNERIPPDIRRVADYFQQELVAQLAGGDVGLMGE
jgi:hypothetical protein